MKSVYSAVRTGSLNKAVCAWALKVNFLLNRLRTCHIYYGICVTFTGNNIDYIYIYNYDDHNDKIIILLLSVELCNKQQYDNAPKAVETSREIKITV